VGKRLDISFWLPVAGRLQIHRRTAKLNTMATKELLTIGYEGMALSAFTDALTKARVTVLADVRAIAHSRRPGFAKTALRTAVEAAGIQYLHIPGLGNPKAGRQAAWAGDVNGYERIFRAHLNLAMAQSGLANLASVARRRRTCLMCMEADPADCHRSIIAAAIEQSEGLKIWHLRPLQSLARCVA
jgi:uncharacterized protein (DUF488 family)